MKIETMRAAELSDADLVSESLSGDRDAFGQIVERYQTLISSLAYCATGNLSQSEDLAQETFVTAWKQLADLREPEKLRSWLCRISRNLTYDALRAILPDACVLAPPLLKITRDRAEIIAEQRRLERRA